MKDKDTQLLQEQYKKLFEQEEDVITIKTWEEWDNLDKQSGKTIYIEAIENIYITDNGNLKVVVKETKPNWVEIFRKVFIIAENDSNINAHQNSTVFAKNQVRVNAWDNSKVFAEDNVKVFAYGDSYVEASDNVKVYLPGEYNEIESSSKIELSGNAKIINK